MQKLPQISHLQFLVLDILKECYPKGMSGQKLNQKMSEIVAEYGSHYRSTDEGKVETEGGGPKFSMLMTRMKRDGYLKYWNKGVKSYFKITVEGLRQRKLCEKFYRVLLIP